MTTGKMCEIARAAVEKYGRVNQVLKAIEELAELQRALARDLPLDAPEETEEAGAVVYQDAIYIALPSRGGMLFIPYEPIKHIKDRYRHYAVRWMRGRPMVAVYEDMFCAALVMPLDNRSAGEMREIARKLAGPTYEWPDPERDAADAEAEAEAKLARMIGEEEEGDRDNGEDEQGTGA